MERVRSFLKASGNTWVHLLLRQREDVGYCRQIFPWSRHCAASGAESRNNQNLCVLQSKPSDSTLPDDTVTRKITLTIVPSTLLVFES